MRNQEVSGISTMSRVAQGLFLRKGMIDLFIHLFIKILYILKKQ